MKFKNLSIGYKHDLKFYNSLKIGDYIIVDYDKTDKMILKVLYIEDYEFPIKCEVIEDITQRKNMVIDNWRFGDSYSYKRITKEEMLAEIL